MSINIELEKPKHITSIASSMVLVSVEVRLWTGTASDEEVADEVSVAKRADHGSGVFVKNLLGQCRSHKKIRAHRQRVYNWVKDVTYPWAPKWGALPNIEVPVFMQEYERLNRERMGLVEAFLTEYPVVVSDAAFRLSGLFKREDYPTADELRGRFGMNLYTSEVPSGDFRNKVCDNLADDLQRHYNRQANAAIETLVKTQVGKLEKVMRAISHCCDMNTVTNDDGTTTLTRRKLHESTIKEAIEYCDLFKQFNPTGDTRLEGIRTDLEQVLLTKDIKALRSSDAARAQTKAEMDSILSKFGF
jgi:hypothetical protein